MSGIVVYSILDASGEGGSSYFATLTEARAAQRDWYGGDLPPIERLTLVDLPPRALAVRLLSGESFVDVREVVK